MHCYWYSVKNVSASDKTAATGDPNRPVGQQGKEDDFHFFNGADDFDMLAYDAPHTFDGSEDYAVLLTYLGRYNNVDQNVINPIYGKVNWLALTEEEAAQLLMPYIKLNISRGQTWFAESFAGALMQATVAQTWTQTGKNKFSDDLQPLYNKIMVGDVGQMRRVAQGITPAGSPTNDDPLSQAMLDAFIADCDLYKQKFPDGT